MTQSSDISGGPGGRRRPDGEETTALAFFSELLKHKPVDHPAYLWAKGGRARYPMAAEDAAGTVPRLGANPYVGCAFLAPGVSRSLTGLKRLTVEHAGGIYGLWLDLDVIGAPNGKGGVKTTGAPDVAAAVALAERIAPPTLLVGSGGGIHAWWLFLEPWTFDGNGDRARAGVISAQWQQAHRELVDWKIDSTHDLARVLRIPGTLNTKGSPPAPVELLKADGPRHELAELAAMVAHVKAAGAGTGEHKPPADGERIPHGERHAHLADFAIRLVRIGVTDYDTVLGCIKVEFATRCDPDPEPEPGSLEALAKWAISTRIADRERKRANGRDDTWDWAQARAHEPEPEPEPATDEAGEVKPDPLVDGRPLDPSAIPPDPPDPIPGFPFIIAATTSNISGPTGMGRSTLAEAGLYDAAKAGHHVAYLGWEVTGDEFDERGAEIARARGDELTPELLAQLANVRYLDLGDNIAAAWAAPKKWTDKIIARYSVAVIDPVAAVASVLGLDFIAGTDYGKFHDRIVEPLKRDGLAVAMLDNIGLDPGARGRPIGASQKTSRPDLTFACKATTLPRVGLVIESTKVRGVRTPWARGDKWLFERDTLQIVPDFGPGDGNAGDGKAKAKIRRTWYMERVSRKLEFESASRNSKTALRAAVGGKKDYVDEATDTLIAEGYVEDRGPKAVPRYDPVRRFREDADRGEPLTPWPDPGPTPGPTSKNIPGPHGPRLAQPWPDLSGPAPGPPGPGPTKGPGGQPRPEPSCNCLRGPAELTDDGRCSRCYGRPQSPAPASAERAGEARR